MCTSRSRDPIIEADEIVERTECRIAQYLRHIGNLEQCGRESEGAALVLARLQRVAVRLRLYRKLLQNTRTARFVPLGASVSVSHFDARLGQRPVH